MALYYFSGQETYLKKAELKKAMAKVDRMNVMECWEDKPEILDFIGSAPFFGNKKICILYFFPTQESLIKAIETMADAVDMYIVTREIPDQRKKATKQILRMAGAKEFPKISRDLLYKCISSRLKRYGYTDQQIEAAKSFLMEAFYSYELDSGMDLEIVQKHVEMIALCGDLSKENISIFAPQSAKLKAYKLSIMLLDQDEGCLDYARHLMEQGEQTIGILSFVLYQIRICYKAVLFMDEKYLSMIGIRNFQLYNNHMRYSVQMYKKVYGILLDGINRVKKGEKPYPVLMDTLADSLDILRQERNV